MKLRVYIYFENVTPIINNGLLKGQHMEWVPNYNGITSMYS
jgi:hypothetical protein